MIKIDPNKKYGLLISRKDKHGNKSFVPKPSVFGNDSDENDEEINGKKAVNRTIMQESTKLKLKKQTQLEIEAALKQDPTVYEYDEIYEQVHRVKETKADRKKVVKESKYINQLKNATNKRKIETERRTERQVQKEREQENGEFAGKEEFVTNSYKKRMLERQIEDEKDRQQDAMEELLDVRKQTNLNGFYRGLYSQTLKKEENPNINIDCNKKNDPENKDSQPERKSPTTSKDCRKEKLNEHTHQRSNSREIDVHRSRGGQMSKEKSKPCSKERGERRSRERGERRSREKDERRSREKDEQRSRERGERRSRERGERRSRERGERRSSGRGERRSKERVSQPFRPHDSRHKEDSSVEKATDTSRSISKVINKQVVATVTEPSLKFGEKRNTETSSAKERYLMRKAQMNVATYKTD